MTAFDDHVQWYWRTLCGPAATAQTLRTPGISEGLIDELVSGNDDSGPMDMPVLAAAAGNPSCSASHLERWVRGHREHSPSQRLRVACEAARNPKLGAGVPELHAELTAEQADVVAEALLANRAAPRPFIAEAATESPVALANPACPVEVLHAALACRRPDGAFQRPAVLRHPACPPEIIDRIIAGPASWFERREATGNPTLTETQLEALIAAGRDSPNISACPAVAEAERRLHLLKWQRDPHNCPALRLRGSVFHPAVAADLETMGDVTTSAVRALLDARFDGTVAELFDVARSFA